MLPTSISTPDNPVDETESTPNEIDHLVVWIPDTIIKTNTDETNKLITRQMDKFTAQHPGMRVETRIKKTEGYGSIMDTLQSANLAASGSIPDLILLSSNNMEVSALKGLIYPYNETNNLLESNDWAPVMKQMGMIQGSLYGVPALADATVLVSKNEPAPGLSIYKVDHSILCYLNDPQALFLVGLYLSSGGYFTNSLANLEIDEAAMGKALELVNIAFVTGAFSSDTMKYQNQAEVVKAFQSDKEDQMITWFSSVPDSQTRYWISAVPGVDDISASLARGWFWVSANPDPLRRSMSSDLVKVLSEPDFLAEIARNTRLIPVRESELISQDPVLQTRLAVLQTANSEPDGLLLVTIGTPFQNAIKAIQEGKEPSKAIAQQVIESLKQP